MQRQEARIGFFLTTILTLSPILTACDTNPNQTYLESNSTPGSHLILGGGEGGWTIIGGQALIDQVEQTHSEFRARLTSIRSPESTPGSYGFPTQQVIFPTAESTPVTGFGPDVNIFPTEEATSPGYVSTLTFPEIRTNESGLTNIDFVNLVSKFGLEIGSAIFNAIYDSKKDEEVFSEVVKEPEYENETGIQKVTISKYPVWDEFGLSAGGQPMFGLILEFDKATYKITTRREENLELVLENGQRMTDVPYISVNKSIPEVYDAQANPEGITPDDVRIIEQAVARLVGVMSRSVYDYATSRNVIVMLTGDTNEIDPLDMVLAKALKEAGYNVSDARGEFPRETDAILLVGKDRKPNAPSTSTPATGRRRSRDGRKGFKSIDQNTRYKTLYRARGRFV